MTIGERIRLLRNQKHLTLAEVAARIGMTSAGLSLIELGKRRITTEQLEMLAVALAVKPAVFFDGAINEASTHDPKEAPADA